MIANPGCGGDDTGEDGDEEEEEGYKEADSPPNCIRWDQEWYPGYYNKQTWGSHDNKKEDKICKS